MSNTHSGSCLCGAVRFEVEGEFERFYLCHCEHCRKGTGSAHAANLFSSTATLRWISGEERLSQFDLPGTRHSRTFCRTCGSPVPMLRKGGGLLRVPAGSLNTRVDMRPTAHIFMASKASWDEALAEVPAFDRLPS